MSDLFTYTEEKEENNKPQHGENILSVTQLSNQLRFAIENQFSYIVVEGEISGWKRASSGHVYFDLKDKDSKINGVIWRSSAQSLKFNPEDGMQVVAYGKITTYGARSNYQIVVSRLEPAGIGLLMQRFEELKAKLESEGLFSPERKKEIPYLPRRIGIVTSPTGAVIDDMKHRIEDRFPRHILLAPVMVQGVGAKEQIAEAIEFFNALPEEKRPDVIIVARGGGSLEDLWAFNEEVVVRAVANSAIPIISGVGHEPDVTLCDYAADWRSPTPSAAAEKVVPVRLDLLHTVSLRHSQLERAMLNELEGLKGHLRVLTRSVPDPQSQLGQMNVRLDDYADRFFMGMKNGVQVRKANMNHMLLRLPQSLQSQMRVMRQRYQQGIHRFSPVLVQRQIERFRDRTLDFNRSLSPEKMESKVAVLKRNLAEQYKLLESFSPNGPLKRGYVYVTDKKGSVLKSAKSMDKGMINLHFHDGEREAELK